MKALFKPFVLLCLLTLAVSASAQEDYVIDITNNTGYTVMFLNVSPASTDEWEEDVMGDEVLMDGDTFRLLLEGYDSPIFDVRLIDEDGDTYTFMGVDVSVDDLEVTLADLDID
ncbi:MAG: hypothetical protein AAGJ52_04280 [Pseudomonadota bacterium]